MVLLNYEWDWPGAYRELQKAAQLNPNSSMIHLYLASYYRTVARIDDAVREAKLAQQLDPVSPLAHRNLGWLYVFAGRYADAEQELKKCLDLDPHFPATRSYLVRVFDQERMFLPAKAEMELDLRDHGENESADQLDQIYRKNGYEKAKRYYFESWIKAAKSPAYDIATWHALLGNKRKALDSLELSYRRRENHMNKLKVNSYFDNLRSEPRFQRLLKDLQLAE
jgi:tetratricopeptide (TPR) repeat protein